MVTGRSPQRRRFATTRWTLIQAAGAGTPDARAALSELCALYWYPVFSFVRRSGHSADDAADYTQGLFADLIARDDLAGLDKERGRFRSWLIAAMKHFLSNERDKANAKKRGGGLRVVSIDVVDAEHRYVNEPRDDVDADKLYMRKWAMTLLDRSLRALRDEYVAEGNGALFDAAKSRIASGDREGGYDELGRTLSMTPGALKTAISRMRKRHRELFRAEVAETVSDDCVPDEIEALIRAVE